MSNGQTNFQREPSRDRFYVIAAFVAGCFLSSTAAWADVSRVLPPEKTPADERLGSLKDLNGYFPFTVPESRQAWDKRAEEVRRRLLVSLGLWPMPEKTPLGAVVHGRIDRDDYTVEKVYFESYPGFYVTGNLYRPKGKEGKMPAVLCPHGHWPNGRFHDHGPKQVLQEIFIGAERFENSGRYPIQARCVQLARMGCVVFHYDMIGYADSQQISFEIAHRFAKQRPEFDSPDAWGFFSTQAELRMQSIMGLQTYNSVRALDWITSLPDVDPERIAVTGASGGGTQTFILCAIDPRPAVAFPAVMVSTAMQGGCTCENASLLRVGTGNIEIAALVAPRPLGMTAADDWTKELAAKGLPELKRHYALLGAKENVMAAPLVHFKHNYNYVSRGVMYHWLNKHLGLGFSEPIVAEDFEPLSAAEMTVWNDEHPKPPGGDAFEIKLTKQMAEASDAQLAALTPTDAESLEKYREVVGGAFDTIIRRRLEDVGVIEREKIDKQDRGDHWLFKDILRNKPHGEELPVVFFHPKKTEWNGQVVVWISGAGKEDLFATDGSPKPEIKKLLDAGIAVASADLFMQGEFLEGGKSVEETRKVNNPREFAGYTFGYNDPLFARRVHDILTLTAYVQSDEHKPKAVHLVGVRGAGPWVAAARAQAGDTVERTAIDTGGFRFVNLKSYRDPNFLPGAVKYGDLPGLLSLGTPGKLWLAGEEDVPAIVAAAYKAASRADEVATYSGKPDGAATAAAGWIIGD